MVQKHPPAKIAVAICGAAIAGATSSAKASREVGTKRGVLISKSSRCDMSFIRMEAGNGYIPDESSAFVA
jgi:hypothetical protein